MNPRAFGLLTGVFVFGFAGTGFAAAPAMFGFGARSEALARADIADADSTSAPVQNAALAAEPGTRVLFGYGYGALDLRVDDRRVELSDVSGFDLAGQVGLRLPGAFSAFSAGLAIAAHLPDAHIASIGFRPGTEPQFVRYESVLQRATFDFAVALRRGPFALGAGAAVSLDMGGEGTTFDLGQDARGTYADAASDILLPYRIAPLFGLSADLGRVKVGASYRGALGLDLSVASDVRIALSENPLNGSTSVLVHGVSGYDPARFSFGASVNITPRLSALGALEWQGYRDAPPPVADVTLDVDLGTSPGRKEVRFVLPNFSDVISPRLGVSWASERGRPGAPRKEGDRAIRWEARAGYVFSPSPVPPQRGFTSYADASSHSFSLGGGLGLGRFWGVDLSVDAAARISVLSPRTEKKDSFALPNAEYTVSGRVFHGSLAIQGAFR